MFQLIFGILLLLVIIFVYTGLGILTREIFADKKCDICLIINNIATIPTAQATAAQTTAAQTTTTRATTTRTPAAFNNINEGFSNNAVKLDLNESELIFSKGAIVLLWIIIIILTIAAVSALVLMK